MPHVRRPTLAAAGLVLAAALAASPAAAGSYVLRVDGPDAPGAGATLGRGFSPGTHTFTTNCFATVAASKPSYDVRYRFDAAGEADGRHHVRIVISFHVYNHSLDEAGSALAPAALDLIARGDLIGFFHACGSSFARTVTRTGTFESILSYQSPEGGRDRRFEQDVEDWIKGWSKPGGAAPASRDLAWRATRNRLAVRTTAGGFGKRAGVSLVADDLETFRAAAQATFRAMYGDHVGEVATVELVPWSDHPLLRGMLGTTRGERRILLENSELVAELERVLEARRVQAGGAARARPSAAEACVGALVDGDTLATRSYHQVPPCRGILLRVAAEDAR